MIITKLNLRRSSDVAELSSRSAARFAAMAIAAAVLTGCAQLHLTQEPDQVIQRTESQDNYDVKQIAGPTAARILPYALLAEQAYDSKVYANHHIAPRATDCISDDAQNCDTLRDSRRVAAWLDEWRYVWSCDGPKECEVRTSGKMNRWVALAYRSGRGRASHVRKA